MRRVTSVAAGVAHLVGPGALKVVNAHLAYTPKGGKALRLDPQTLTEVLCYGDVSATAAALEALFRGGIPTAWLSPAGLRCRGRLQRTDPPTTMVRIRQHQAFAQPAARLAWAKRVVDGKLVAMSEAARHYQRHGATNASSILTTWAGIRERLPTATLHEQVLGYEGSASNAWFAFFGGLLGEPWTFSGRTRRPPTDPVNALLSLGYTWLLNRVIARAETKGFEIYLGGLHEYRAGRPSLACDLMEPLRVPAVDRWVVWMCRQGNLHPSHFRQHEDGGFRLLPARFAITLAMWEEHWQQQRLDEHVDWWLNDLSTWMRQWYPDEPMLDGENTGRSLTI